MTEPKPLGLKRIATERVLVEAIAAVVRAGLGEKIPAAAIAGALIAEATRLAQIVAPSPANSDIASHLVAWREMLDRCYRDNLEDGDYPAAARDEAELAAFDRLMTALASKPL